MSNVVATMETGIIRKMKNNLSQKTPKNPQVRLIKWNRSIFTFRCQFRKCEILIGLSYIGIISIFA